MSLKVESNTSELLTLKDAKFDKEEGLDSNNSNIKSLKYYNLKKSMLKSWFL